MSTPFDTDSSGAAAQASKRQRAGTATAKDVPDLSLSVPVHNIAFLLSPDRFRPFDLCFFRVHGLWLDDVSMYY